jgi:hypothetical protein
MDFVPDLADVRDAVGRMPHGHGEQLSMPITGGCDVAVGMMCMEQQQDRFLSRTPPEINANGQLGRMHLGEQHTLPILGGRRLHGDQYMPPVQEGRAPHSGHGQHESCFTNPLQREQRWQGFREDKGYVSRKVPNANAYYTSGKALVKELHHVTLPAGSSVPVEIMENQECGLEGGRIGKVVLEHGIDGKVVVEESKSELSYENSKIRFAGHDEQYDGDDREDAIIEQMTQNLVIDGSGDAKGVVLEKTILRSKVNWIFFITCVCNEQLDFNSRFHNLGCPSFRVQQSTLHQIFADHAITNLPVCLLFPIISPCAFYSALWHWPRQQRALGLFYSYVQGIEWEIGGNRGDHGQPVLRP